MTEQEKREKLIESIIKMCELNNEPVTREEAEYMADLEIKANGLPNYTSSEEKKVRKPRTIKKDPAKISFMHYLEEWLTNSSVSDIIMVNEQREISFKIADDTYSLVLTKHRPSKKEKNA